MPPDDKLANTNQQTSPSVPISPLGEASTPSLTEPVIPPELTTLIQPVQEPTSLSQQPVVDQTAPSLTATPPPPPFSMPPGNEPFYPEGTNGAEFYPPFPPSSVPPLPNAVDPGPTSQPALMTPADLPISMQPPSPEPAPTAPTSFISRFKLPLFIVAVVTFGMLIGGGLAFALRFVTQAPLVSNTAQTTPAPQEQITSVPVVPKRASGGFNTSPSTSPLTSPAIPLSQ